MDLTLVSLSIFALSSLFLLFLKFKKRKENEVEAQFLITGTLLLVFYIVCFLSGVCTILNFLFRWIF